MNALIAYHGKQEVKDEYINRVRAHREADQLVKEFYWDGSKGCAVGCTIHGKDHGKYETALGIPRQLAYLEDRLFEKMPDERSQRWPEEFLQAITPGADLTGVADRFLHWLLVDEVDGVIRFAKTVEQWAAISHVGELYQRKIAGEVINVMEWRNARIKCWHVSAAATGNFSTADDDVAAATAAAAYAADDNDDAAAAYATDPYAADKNNARERQADKLIELLKAAPVVP